jgi:phospholipid/cholesterol/gamma-HCH transport system substrate-binding protein
MQTTRRVAGMHPGVWAAIFVVAVIAIFPFTSMAFNRNFTSYTPVTIVSDRAGLVMEPYAAVKFHGVVVGRVSSIQHDDPVRLQLEVDSDELKHIPANVGAEIDSPTVFGPKYVELLPPSRSDPERLAAGAVVRTADVSIEANTVFQNVVGVLNQIDVSKLNAVLSALAEGVRGKGEVIGEAVTDLNEVLLALNPRSDTIRADLRSLKGVADTYGAAAPNLLATLDAASTTSTTISDNAQALDSLLLNVVGVSNSGIKLIGPNKDNLVHGINVLEPTTRLLMQYNPELTCTLLGAKQTLDSGLLDSAGGRDGKSAILDTSLLAGADAYRYPDNLPVTGEKGGPGGAPSCGSLPDVSKNWPVRYLVTNSGWGTGMDVRPNPGIGFPGFANFLPGTRATPQPPTIRDPGGPAPGPVPYPGAPPYGAQEYAPDGTPLYPGLPPAPPPGRPRDPGPPPPGSEPFVPPYPGTPTTPLPNLPPVPTDPAPAPDPGS